MKTLKNKQEFTFKDLKALRCKVCAKKIFDQENNIVNNGRIFCPQCGTLYIFEPTRWKVFPEKF